MCVYIHKYTYICARTSRFKKIKIEDPESYHSDNHSKYIFLIDVFVLILSHCPEVNC